MNGSFIGSAVMAKNVRDVLQTYTKPEMKTGIIENKEDEDIVPEEDVELEMTFTGLSREDRSMVTGKRKSDREFTQRHSDFAMECLRAHNQYRLIHGVEPLRLCKKLCKYSGDWALYLAKLGHILRRHGSTYGENMYLVWPTKWDCMVKGSEPAEEWYRGIGDYSFGAEPCNLLCLNFTQMVWRDTRRFGAAIARGEDGKIFVVANYEPCGNVLGEFSSQVYLPTIELEGPFESLLEETRPQRAFNAVQRECLLLHNDLRLRHGVPFLTLHAGLNRAASEWAQKLSEEDRGAYREDNPLGENVFFFLATDPDERSRVGVRNAVDAWYSEIKHVTFGAEPLDNMARNFCQMVWRSTRKMGVGVASGRGGRVLVVANYYPRGNVMGRYRDNVFPPRGQEHSEPYTPLPSEMSSAPSSSSGYEPDAEEPCLTGEPGDEAA